MIGLNMKGPFRLSALVGRRMCDQEWHDGETGSIINISSNASQRPNMSAAVYGAAKLSLNYFTELFAEVCQHFI
jgi:short-subunit dehydrogenase